MSPDRFKHEENFHTDHVPESAETRVAWVSLFPSLPVRSTTLEFCRSRPHTHTRTPHAQVIATQLQAASKGSDPTKKGQGFLDVARQLYAENGIRGFWKVGTARRHSATPEPVTVLGWYCLSRKLRGCALPVGCEAVGFQGFSCAYFRFATIKTWSIQTCRNSQAATMLARNGPNSPNRSTLINQTFSGPGRS